MNVENLILEKKKVTEFFGKKYVDKSYDGPKIATGENFVQITCRGVFREDHIEISLSKTPEEAWDKLMGNIYKYLGEVEGSFLHWRIPLEIAQSDSGEYRGYARLVCT